MNPARMIGAAVVFWDFTHMILYVISSLGEHLLQHSPHPDQESSWRRLRWNRVQ